MQQYQRVEMVSKWMDYVNAPSHSTDVFDRFVSHGNVVATVFVDDAPVRGSLQILSTHILIVDDAHPDHVLLAMDLDHIHTFKRYQEVLFPNRSFAEIPKFRSTLEFFMHGAAMHRLVLDGERSSRIAVFLELLWKFHYGKLSQRLEATCRGYHLGDALFALSLLPFDVDCMMGQQIQGSSVVTVEKPVVLRIDEHMLLSIIFRPETLADTALTRAIEIPFDAVVLITGHDDELRIVSEDGRVFTLHSIRSELSGGFIGGLLSLAGGGGGGSNSASSPTAGGGSGTAKAPTARGDATGSVDSPSDNLFTIFFANAATMVYRKLQFQYPFYTFRHVEVARLFDHYLHIDANADGTISQDEFNTSLGPILAQIRTVPKALYALCDCFARGKIRLFEYLHGFRVLLKGNYQDRVRYLFLLFDTKRSGSISYLQFLDGLKLLATAVDLRIPKGETLESVTFRLFNEMDVNRDNSIQFEEFEVALKSNFGLSELLRGATMVGSGQRQGVIPDATPSSPMGGRTDKGIGSGEVETEAATEDSTGTGNSGRGGGALESGSSEASGIVNPAKVLSFGHPQWIQICQILAGIEMSVLNTAWQRDAPDSAAAQSAKLTYNIPNGAPPTAGSSAEGGSGGGGLLRNPFSRTTSDTVTFSDYSPAVFDAIRRRFGVSRQEYLESLGFTQAKRHLFLGCLSALYEMSSSGRSGSFFYASTNNRYILKTIPQAESATLRKMLPAYLEHLKRYPNTLITRFCGLHALTKGGMKLIFVVMQNIFNNTVPIQETFDLKGSRINRSTPMELRHLGVALKDNDFEGRKLYVSPSIKDLLVAQIEADSMLLSRHNLNDYSFLLGVHRSADGPLPPDDPARTAGPKFTAFQRDYGGILSTNQRSEVYFVGIIDCLTDYGLKKMGEHISKSVLYDSRQVSCVPPQEYHKRFVEYLSSIFLTTVPSAAISTAPGTGSGGAGSSSISSMSSQQTAVNSTSTAPTNNGMGMGVVPPLAATATAASTTVSSDTHSDLSQSNKS